MDGFQFERLMARAYEKLGYTVERRGGVHADDGIDLVLHRNGETVGVQCKHWKAWKVNPKTVREMVGAITAAKLRAGIILCGCGFTQDGHAKAAEYGISPVDAPGILQILVSADARFDPEMQALLDDQRKFCPRGESPMMLRTAAKGTKAGESFWGCSRYPRCDHTLPVATSLAELHNEAHDLTALLSVGDPQSSCRASRCGTTSDPEKHSPHCRHVFSQPIAARRTTG